ncbi:hypothetical protein [Fructilactobacillus florum]|uniref:hypothetical protein n=1 Tax=Fructilactobacillus florum TaxID=640331 RepID=UPI0020927D14|nr:hypothetical protein [Fructilactobacillus florum]
MPTWLVVSNNPIVSGIGVIERGCNGKGLVTVVFLAVMVIDTCDYLYYLKQSKPFWTELEVLLRGD